ncbi:MAG: hypothetical protein R3292_12605 [Alcanivorax sp.]|nr:hypothetical protein [Alcanivorax sp.]
MSLKKNLATHAVIALIALSTLACADREPQTTSHKSNMTVESMAGGNLSCYSDRKGNNLIWTGNSAHNCCSNRGGKSWRCGNGPVVKCSVNNSYHCP